MKFRYSGFRYITFLVRYIKFVLSDSIISKSVISNSLRPSNRAYTIFEHVQLTLHIAAEYVGRTKVR